MVSQALISVPVGSPVQGSRPALAFGRDRASMSPPLAATLLLTKARRDRVEF